MVDGKRDVASSLGSAVRALLWLLQASVLIAGCVLISWGIWQIYMPAGYIAVGVFLLFFVWPRPDRRK